MRPGSTKTFLFSDVEASTSRWAADPEGMAADLSVHDAVLRDAVTRHGGEVFKHTGDGICASFTSAAGAVAAALDAQRRLPLPVRIGIHTGDATARDGDWFGPALNRTARITAAGHGGQVLCSTATAKLLDGEIELVDLGDFRLKGFEGAERILQVGTGAHPPLRAPAATAELPTRHPALIGRETLAEEVVEALGSARLVTLVGPGGVGKTSLALEVAHRVSDRYDRAAFVDLSIVDDGSAIPAAVAQSLSLSTAAPASIHLALSAGTTALLVDNCEHLLVAAADLIAGVLASCPSVTVLATSREALEVPGERLIAVEPLDDDDAMTTLFFERAKLVGASVRDDEREAVLQICHRLDGLPLAIELAVARLTVLSVSQLADRLDHKLDLLGSTRRRARDRHRTLQETIDWSYDLLDADEQKLYRRLAVFNDRFDVDAAVAVAGGTSEVGVIDLLEALHAKSVLVADAGTPRRYRYLESIRDHAWHRLESAGEATEAMQSMADHLGERISAIVDELMTAERTDAASRMRALLPLRRRAIEWCVARGDVDRAAALVAPFVEIPWVDARFVTGAGAVCSIEGAMEHPSGPALLALHGLERMHRQDFRAYRSVLDELRERLGSDDVIASAAGGTVSYLALIAGDDDMLLRIYELRSGMSGSYGAFLRLGAESERILRGLPGALEIDEWLELADRVPSRLLRGLSMTGLARAAGIVAPDRVGEIADRGLELLEPGTSGWLTAYIAKAGWYVTSARLPEALEAAGEVVAEARRIGEHSALVPALAVHALVLRALDAPREAALLRGALPRRWTVYLTRQRDELDAWLAGQLDDDERRSLLAKGAALDLDAAFEIAPSVLQRRRKSPRATVPPRDR